MKNSLLLVVLAALGGAAGYGVRTVCATCPCATAKTAAAAKAESGAAEAAAAHKDKAAAMRRRIKELEAKLAARRDGEEGAGEASDKADSAGSSESGQGDSRQLRQSEFRLANLMKLKEENPAQFVSTTNHSCSMCRWQQQQAKVRFDYFSRADVSKMTDAERAVHEELLGCQEALGQIAEIGSVWDRSAEIEDARTAADRDIESRIVDLYQAEARTLVRLKALELGYTPDDSEEIAESVSGLLKATYNTTRYIGKMD